MAENAGALSKPHPTKIMGTCCFANLEIQKKREYASRALYHRPSGDSELKEHFTWRKTQGARRRVLEHNWRAKLVRRYSVDGKEVIISTYVVYGVHPVALTNLDTIDPAFKIKA